MTGILSFTYILINVSLKYENIKVQGGVRKENSTYLNGVVSEGFKDTQGWPKSL